MTIWATPFNRDSKQCTGPSAPAGFETFEQVIEAMGEPTVKRRAFLVYGEGADRVLFSRLEWNPEAPR